MNHLECNTDECNNEMTIIDSGSYSKVYLFHHNNIKLIRKRCIKDILSIDEINYVYKEIYILKNLNHKNIIKYHSHNDSINFIDIILSYGGKCLKRIYHKLTKQEIKIIVKNILNSLIYIHNKNIIHCDLNLSNILIKNINLGQIYLCDFGLSVDHNHDYIYPINNMIGNNKFLSPEIIKQEKISSCSDLWSLGIIVYYLLTNNYPFRNINSNNIDEKLNNFLNSQYNKSRLSEIEFDFIKKLLVINPSKRLSAKEALQHEWLNN